jgi:hypothetical protein
MTFTAVVAVVAPLVPLTVTVYIPVLVPGLVGRVSVFFIPPPHPIAAPAMAANTRRGSKIFLQRRRRIGSPKKRSADIATLPRSVKICFSFLSSAAVYGVAVDAAMVLIVSVAVTAAVPEIAAGAVVEQVGALTAPAGRPLTTQVSSTVPVKPPAGVIVIIDVPLAPGDAMLTAVLLSAKLGMGAIAAPVNAIVLEALPL